MTDGQRNIKAKFISHCYDGDDSIGLVLPPGECVCSVTHNFTRELCQSSSWTCRRAVFPSVCYQSCGGKTDSRCAPEGQVAVAATAATVGQTCNTKHVTVRTAKNLITFYRAARSCDENSVCLSVCLSNACIVTKRKKNQSRFLYHVLSSTIFVSTKVGRIMSR